MGYSDDDVSAGIKDDVFVHFLNANIQKVAVKYILTLNLQEIFDTHKLLWNQNSDTNFIAVGKKKSHIINVKSKPDRNNPLRKGICLESFDYGINSKGYENINVEKIRKEYIDSTYFFEFVHKKQAAKTKKEVDKDLLLNLLYLRSDMLQVEAEQTVHLLILRCLFVKYLEDRRIFDKNYLVNILKSNEPRKLIVAFNEVCKINGDVFGGIQLTASDINSQSLGYLTRFFTCDYQTGQGSLFPYEFNHIPIQLISHVYEAFLKSDMKKGNGVYYTPPFVVDFMLSQTLKKTIVKNNEITILDPAVGSAAFLVESFKIIHEAYGKNINFEKKKWILENQLFGIDVDKNALQIAAFSLYLALLETEKAEFIKKQIEIASPILPKLIGKTLIHANAITDNPFDNKKFGLIISNPPWGSVPNDGEQEHIAEREAIDNKNKKYKEYTNVADYERSQAFLMRVAQWGDEKTKFTLIVKNSIFLNEQAFEFRQELLEKYEISTFYELSHYNKILFRKKIIGEIKGQKIETGATEPCAIVTFSTPKEKINSLCYIAPRLTSFAEHVEFIQYSQSETHKLPQKSFKDNDLLWRILVNSDAEGFDLLTSNIAPQKEIEIEARAGFQPKRNMKQLGEPIWRELLKSKDFESYVITNKKLEKFNWNQELHRKRDENIFKGSRIVIPIRPLKKDKLQIRGIHIDSDVVYSDDIIVLKFFSSGENINCYDYLGLINSKLMGYYLYNISVQWGKGDAKRATLRNTDIEVLPVKEINKTENSEIVSLVEEIIKGKNVNKDISDKEKQLNDLIFDLYDLLNYEKEIINEFYQVNVDRVGEKECLVRQSDMEMYFKAFKDTFSLVLSPGNSLNASFHISSNVGTVICISIVNKDEVKPLKDDPNLQILNYVKSNQLKDAEISKIFNEEKVKIYDETHFFIIKSKYIKDWTVRQAIKDAKEEIEGFLKQLT